MASHITNNKRTENKTSHTMLDIVAGAVIIYVIGVFFFSGHFYPRSYLGAVDVSGKTYAQAQSLLESKSQEYTLSVSGQDLHIGFVGSDFGLQVDAVNSVDAAKKSKSAFTWPISIFKRHFYNKVQTTYDISAVDEQVSNEVAAFNKDKTPPTDATIAYNEENKSFSIQHEAVGTQVDSIFIEQKVAQAIERLDGRCMLSSDALMRPAILSSDERLAKAVEVANAYCDVDAKFVAEKTNEEMLVLDASVVSDWIELDEKLEVRFNDEKRLKWAKTIAEDMNTVGSKRTYVRPNGNKEIVVEGGDYGWEIDADHVIAAINDAIDNKSKDTIELKFSAPGNGYVDKDRDFGAYCDVDLSEQHAYYYDENGKLLWESGIVSGLPADGNDTPTGVYFVKGKETNVVLKGKINPKTKKPEYESPVAYWIPFIGNSYGLHDASWQPASAFNDKTAYQWRGSHGCVNLPTDKVAQLYDIIEVDDPVIIHW